MAKGLSVVVRGDPNIQLRGTAATLRSVVERVQPRIMPLICAQIPSTRAFEQIVFVSAVPKIRKWVTERAGGVVATLTEQINNDTYEISMAISGDDYDDDQVGAYAPIMQEMMVSLLLAPDELVVSNLMANATTTLGYDGVPFYGATHKWPNGNFQTAQVNKQTQSGTDPASIENDYFTARNAIATWKDDQGRLRIPPGDLIGNEALVVHHPQALEQAMERVFDKSAGGEAQQLQPISDQTKFPRLSQVAGKVIRIADPYLDTNIGATQWFIHSIRGVGYNKPFAFLDREGPSVQIFARGSEHYAKYNEVLILGRRRFGLGVLKPERSQRIG